jgi:S-adenosylmethionine:tRNA ribosyltransferase-isomerase
VFAAIPGAVAAPTAGLHFTPELLSRLSRQGVGSALVTLHVGPGTFKSVSAENIEDHRVDAERYEVTADTAALINATRPAGGRIVAVGTTSVRTIETLADDHGVITAGAGRSALFLYPPYRFKSVDFLLTNFHLPRSSLLMLVCAFAGTGLIRQAYAEAIAMRYRFYSYGDCMLIV